MKVNIFFAKSIDHLDCGNMQNIALFTEMFKDSIV